MLAYLIAIALICGSLLTILGTDPRAGRGARHRAAGLPRYVTWAEDKVMAPRHRLVALVSADLITPATSGPSTGQLDLIA